MVFSGDIYIEKHQGKHADGDWQYRGRSGSTFSPAVASRVQLDLFRVIVVKVFWMDAFEQPTGVDKFFEFPDIKQVAKNSQDETSGVHVQASHQSIGSGEGFFQFHCYPDNNALKRSRVTVRGDEFSRIAESFDMSLR